MLKLWVVIFVLLAFTYSTTTANFCRSQSQRSQVEEFKKLLKSYSTEMCEAISGGVEPTDRRCKEKPSTSEPKKVDKLTSLQRLFKWLTRMKNIWSEFPVFEKEKRPSEDFLRLCDITEATLGEGLAHQNGTLAGRGILSYDSESSCSKETGIKEVNGSFIDGKLSGMSTIHFTNQSILRAPFNLGSISGLARMFSCQYVACDFNEESWNIPNWLSWVSFFSNGKKIGPSWDFKIGGGVLVGHVDEEGEHTGANLVYAYPDFTTLLVGQFSKGVMIAAKQTSLIGVKFDKTTKVPYILFDKNLLNSMQEVFSYQEPTKTSIGQGPLQQDPYERQMMYVSQSKVNGAGFGVFARRSARRGTLMGYYNGIKLSNMESSVLSKDGRKSQYRIDNDWAKDNQVIDIPNDFRSVQKYNATLGHILNHSPKPNAWYGMVDHPRFGKIRSIVLKSDVQAGDELFCDYGYLDSYVQSETAMKTLYNIGKMILNKNDKEFAQEIKRHLSFIKGRSNEFEPYFNMFKMAAAVLTNK